MSDDIIRINCCKDGCGTFPMDRALYQRYKRSGEWWSCPAGHEQHFTETSESEKVKKFRQKVEELETQVERLEQSNDRFRENARDMWEDTRELQEKLDRVIAENVEYYQSEYGSGVIEITEEDYIWACDCGGRGRAVKSTRAAAEVLYEQHQEQSCGLTHEAVAND